MIVAQLIETLTAGGAEALAVQIANTWAERGHQSHLIVISAAGPFRDKLSPAVHFHELKVPSSGRTSLRRSPHLIAGLGRLHGLIRDRGIEAMQTHLPMANFFGLVAGWRRSCRVYPTVHNNREFDYGEASGPIRESLRRFAYRQMLTWCSRMIAVSDQVRAAMIAELNLPGGWTDRIAVVPNGVPVPPPVSPEERAAARTRQSVEADEVLVVGVGRLTAQKNFQALVEALALVDAAAGPWRCLVAGEGEMGAELAALVEARNLKGRIEFLGHVADVGGLLGAADIFCLPSRFEGLPLVLLEAMASGLPVAAFAIDGVTDVVEDGRQALLAPPEDVGRLAGNLEQLIGDGNLRRRLGAEARDLVASRYGFDRVADGLEGVCSV